MSEEASCLFVVETSGAGVFVILGPADASDVRILCVRMYEYEAADACFRRHCAGLRESDLQCAGLLAVAVALRVTVVVPLRVTVVVGVLVVVAAACAVWPMRVMGLSSVACRSAVSAMGVRDLSSVACRSAVSLMRVVPAGGFAEEFQDVAFEAVVWAAGVACCRFDDLQRNF